MTTLATLDLSLLSTVTGGQQQQTPPPSPTPQPQNGGCGWGCYQQVNSGNTTVNGDFTYNASGNSVKAEALPTP